MGLRALISGPNSERMSLVEYLNGVRNGTVQKVPDRGGLGELMDGAAELPLRPAPAPKPCSYQKELDEQRAQDAADKNELRVVLTAKRSAASDQREMQKLDQALSQLGEMKNAG